MGRIKIDKEKKKKELTISIPKEIYKEFEKLEIKNKSKFFNWLLEEYFNKFCLLRVMR